MRLIFDQDYTNYLRSVIGYRKNRDSSAASNEQDQDDNASD